MEKEEDLAVEKALNILEGTMCDLETLKEEVLAIDKATAELVKNASTVEEALSSLEKIIKATEGREKRILFIENNISRLDKLRKKYPFSFKCVTDEVIGKHYDFTKELLRVIRDHKAALMGIKETFNND